MIIMMISHAVQILFCFVQGDRSAAIDRKIIPRRKEMLVQFKKVFCFVLVCINKQYNEPIIFGVSCTIGIFRCAYDEIINDFSLLTVFLGRIAHHGKNHARPSSYIAPKKVACDTVCIDISFANFPN